MQEKISDVALELVDYVRAARETGETNGADLNAAIERLFQADGDTAEDSLAILAYAGIFLAQMVDVDNHSYDAGLLSVSLRCVYKSVCVLERITGKKADDYI